MSSEDLHNKEERDGEGGNWREEGRLVVDTAIANENLSERRAGYRPIVSEVFQAETTLLQAVNFNIDLGDVVKWSDFVCDAPRIILQECTSSRTYWNTRKRTRLAAMEFVFKHSLCAEKPRWTLATMVYMQGNMILPFLKLGGEVKRGMWTGTYVIVGLVVWAHFVFDPESSMSSSRSRMV